jgi:hypothetical protein
VAGDSQLRCIGDFVVVPGKYEFPRLRKGNMFRHLLLTISASNMLLTREFVLILFIAITAVECSVIVLLLVLIDPRS